MFLKSQKSHLKFQEKQRIRNRLRQISCLSLLIILTGCSSESTKNEIHFGPGPDDERAEKIDVE